MRKNNITWNNGSNYYPQTYDTKGNVINSGKGTFTFSNQNNMLTATVNSNTSTMGTMLWMKESSYIMRIINWLVNMKMVMLLLNTSTLVQPQLLHIKMDRFTMFIQTIYQPQEQ